MYMQGEIVKTPGSLSRSAPPRRRPKAPSQPSQL